MTTREEFEKWVSQQAPQTYMLSLWDAWRSSRTAALEEAAKECDLMAKSYEASFELERADAAEQCAMGIRALKD